MVRAAKLKRRCEAIMSDQMSLYDQAKYAAVLPDDEDTISRSARQRFAVLQAMRIERWWTLEQLARYVEAPIQSVSARVRDLRKAKYGGHVVTKRFVRKGVWEYRLVK